MVRHSQPWPAPSAAWIGSSLFGCALAVAVALVVSAPTARAAWTADGVKLSAPGASVQATRLAADPTGGAYVSFTRVSPDLGTVVLRLAADGELQPGWGAGAVEVPGADLLHLGADGAGGAMLLWNAPGELRARRLDGSGADVAGWSPSGNILRVFDHFSSPTATGSESAVQALHDPTGGGWFVTRYSDRVCPDICQEHDELRLWRFDPAGTAPATYQTISSASFQLAAGGGVWSADAGALSAGFSYFPAGPTFVRRWAGAPSLAWESAGGVGREVLLLADDAAGGAVGFDRALFNSSALGRMRRYTASGESPVGWPADGILVRDPEVPCAQFSAVGDGSGGVLAAWTETGASGTEVHVQRLLASGARAPGWPAEGVVACAASGSRDGLVLAADGTGGAFLAWVDRRVDPDGDVFASHVLAGGSVAPEFAAQGSPVAIAPGGKRALRLARLASGDAIVAWEDLRDGAPALYAQRIPVPGTLAVPPHGGPTLQLAGFRPNPARGTARVAFSLPAPADVTLELFDIAGRSVHRAALGVLDAGAHVEPIRSLQPLPAGLYLVRLTSAGDVRTARGFIAY